MTKKLMKTNVFFLLLLFAFSLSPVVESPTADFIPPVITMSEYILTREEADSMTQEDLVEYFEYWDNQ